MTSFDLRARLGEFQLEAAASWEAPSAALFGASGSGKSTILEAMAGLRREVSGSVVVAGEEVHITYASHHLVGLEPGRVGLAGGI